MCSRGTLGYLFSVGKVQQGVEIINRAIEKLANGYEVEEESLVLA